MKRSFFCSSLCFGAGLLLSGTALAQNAPPPVPTNEQAHPAANNTQASPSDMHHGATQTMHSSTDNQPVQDSTTFISSKGAKVTINSQNQPLPSAQPAPSFASLAGASGHSITRAEASAYPPLANDFEYADSNKNGRISKSEYTRWKNH